MQKRTVLRAAALAVTLTAAPFTFTPAKGLARNDACGQVKLPGTGTCCYQTSAMCVTPSGNVEGRYFKSEGMCP
jgi:hypothetical protein